jgi:O-antigen/teichoic acid export membrane protein
VEPVQIPHAVTPSSPWRSLVSNALLVAVAGGFASALNLGVTIGISRLLVPTRYAAYGQLVGVFFVVAISGSALGVAVVRRAGFYIVNGDQALTTQWQQQLHWRVVRAASICAVLAAPLSVPLAAWLGHRSWLAVWLTVLSGLTFAVLSVDRALLQARQRYGVLAQNFVFEGVVRTIFTLVGVTQGVTGYAIGLLIAELLTRAHAYRLVRLRAEKESSNVPLAHTGITQELLVALATLALMATLQFLDVFVIGHNNARGAGSYTAISQIAKILVYGAVILGSFLLPEAVLASRKGAEAVRQLALVLGFLSVAAVGFVILSAVAAAPTVSNVFGKRYSHASSSLEVLVLAMVALSISTILVTFLLGDGARWPTAWIALCVGVGVWWVNGAGGKWHLTALRDLEVQGAVLAGLVIATTLRLRGHWRSVVSP